MNTTQNALINPLDFPAKLASRLRRHDVAKNRADEYELGEHKIVSSEGVELAEITISLGQFGTTSSTGRRIRAWRFAVRFRPVGRDYWNYQGVSGDFATALETADRLVSSFGKSW